jgi:xanthine/uracil/vitamin C permease (AzgA family)
MAMLIFAGFVLVFLFGLVQWARSGAVLWDILRLNQSRPARGVIVTAENQEADARSITALRNMESVMDGLLRSSFRVLGVLALGVWLFVIASVIIDALGLDWLDSLSFQANRFWGSPATRSSYGATHRSGRDRVNVFRSLGSVLRR